MVADDGGAGSEPDPRTAVSRGDVWVEDVGKQILWDPVPIVLYTDLDVCTCPINPRDLPPLYGPVVGADGEPPPVVVACAAFTTRLVITWLSWPRSTLADQRSGWRSKAQAISEP